MSDDEKVYKIIEVFKQEAIYWAQESGEPDLVLNWLQEYVWTNDDLKNNLKELLS